MKRFLIGLLLSCMASGTSFAMEPVDIYRQHSSSVVLIYALFDGYRQGGSGFIVRKDGLIMTNAHVVTNKNGKPADAINVFLKPERVTGDYRKDLSRGFKAKLVSYDSSLDIALLKLAARESLNALRFADSDDVEIGEKVVAIGHPEQGGLWTLTTGSVSARKMDLSKISGKHVFQTEASINHGNSGGPLISSSGRIIGMNTSIARVSKTGSAITGVNFSLQSNVLLKWLNQHSVSVTAEKNDTRKASQKRSKKLETQKAEVVEKPERKMSGHSNKLVASSGAVKKEGEILTEKRPFKWEEIDAVASDLNDLMDRMRGEVGKRFKNRR